MGMDIYGLNPRVKENSKKPNQIDLSNTTRQEADNYFEEVQKFQDENKGVYFRNNIWWWRPLANLIIELNKSWLSEKQKENMHNNSGQKYNARVAELIKKSLEQAVEEGLTKQLEKEWKVKAKQAEKWNKGIDKEMDKLKQDAILITKNKNIAPINYPENIKLKWDKLWHSRDLASSYPFSEKNVKEFIDFLNECGGFEIC